MIPYNCAEDGGPIPVLVPGWNGSGTGHWQAIWRADHPRWGWVEQANWAEPRCGEWVNQLDETVAACPGRVIIVAHSLGCVAFAHWASFARERVRQKVEGAFLVAPADVEREGAPPAVLPFAPMPKWRIQVPTMLIASENDPCMAFQRARLFALRWNSQFVNAGQAGHINVASGHGPWPGGMTLLGGFLRDLAAPCPEFTRKLRPAHFPAGVGGGGRGAGFR
jgi:uncharacterized protein